MKINNKSRQPVNRDRDIAEVSIFFVAPEKRPDPAERGFFSRCENPTPEEICIASLASSLRTRVKRGSISRSVADRELDDYRQRLEREPFSPNFRPLMMAKPPGWKDVPDVETKQEHGPNGATLEPLTFRRVSEILAMQFNDSDFILKNGYIAKGDPFALCGAGGIGKSRLILQLLIAIITGRDFLGWPTNGRGTRWLLLQSENVCRRLKSDLWAMCASLSTEEMQLVDECLLIHTLETGDDSFLHLNIAENQERVAKVIEQSRWAGVVFDVLRDYSVDNLSDDEGMQDTLAMISRLVRKNNPHCIIGIAHHARTGKAGAASATGFDRTSFGRNSKVLLGWVRAQINVAPYNPDDNEVLLIASAKCNNAPEFKPFAVRLNLKTMFYERDDSISEMDIAEWNDGVSGNRRAKPKKKKTEEDVLVLVPDPSDIALNNLIVEASDNGIGEKRTRAFVDKLVDEKTLFIHHRKRSGIRDEIRVSRYPEIAENNAEQNAPK